MHTTCMEQIVYILLVSFERGWYSLTYPRSDINILSFDECLWYVITLGKISPMTNSECDN